MTANRRKFTEAEKLQILQQAKESNISKVLREHHLSYSVFSRWKQQLQKPNSVNTNEDLINLKNENARLKRIVAEQALELEIKKERERRV